MFQDNFDPEDSEYGYKGKNFRVLGINFDRFGRKEHARIYLTHLKQENEGYDFENELFKKRRVAIYVPNLFGRRYPRVVYFKKLLENLCENNKEVEAKVRKIIHLKNENIFLLFEYGIDELEIKKVVTIKKYEYEYKIDNEEKEIFYDYSEKEKDSVILKLKSVKNIYTDLFLIDPFVAIQNIESGKIELHEYGTHAFMDKKKFIKY